jgi:hypothetical protein
VKNSATVTQPAISHQISTFEVNSLCGIAAEHIFGCLAGDSDFTDLIFVVLFLGI